MAETVGDVPSYTQDSLFGKKNILYDSYIVLLNYFTTQSPQEAQRFASSFQWMFFKSSPSQGAKNKAVKVLKDLVVNDKIVLPVRISAQVMINELEVIEAVQSNLWLGGIWTSIFLIWFVIKIWPRSKSSDDKVLINDKHAYKKKLHDMIIPSSSSDSASVQNALTDEWRKAKNNPKQKLWYLKELGNIIANLLPTTQQSNLIYIDDQIKKELIELYSERFGSAAEVLGDLARCWPDCFNVASVKALKKRCVAYEHLLRHGAQEVNNILRQHLLPIVQTAQPSPRAGSHS